MSQGKHFRRMLPMSQIVVAGVFGGWGLWQRNEILSHDYLFGIGWNSTARFHVWPWPFKFAAISNLPAFLVGMLLTWPIGAAWPKLNEAAQLAPSLLFVGVLWLRIGSWADLRWAPTEKAPWALLTVFTAVSLTGALIPIGYTGYLTYGALVWLVVAIALRYIVKCSPPSAVLKESGINAPSVGDTSRNLLPKIALETGIRYTSKTCP